MVALTQLPVLSLQMITNYGVLRGNVINAIPYQQGNDHYQVELKAGKDLYRIAIDVYSALAGTKIHYRADGPPTLQADRMVMFYKDENYAHPITAALLQLQAGFTAKKNIAAGLWLDYLRTSPSLFPITQMKVVPPKQVTGGPSDNLNADIDPWIQQAKNNPDAEVFAFGSGWDDRLPGARPDPTQYFHPNPLLGIHDIHMNQGDTGHEAVHNGSFQDGALFIHFRQKNHWIAMFFKFQNQSLHTGTDGNPL